MTCVQCGAWQSGSGANARFCSNCGATLPAAPLHDQPTYVQQPYYGGPGYDDAVPGLAHEPAPQRGPTAPADRDWLHHPGTWVIAATALLVAGIVLAAVIVSSGKSGDRDQAAAPASTSASPSSAAPASSPSSAPPSTATQTVVVVPAAPGTPAVTRTVTVAPDQPTGDGSGPFAGSTEVDSSYYLNGSALYFDSPSHNIGCRLVYGGYEAQCTIADYSFSEPGHDCELGAGVLMDAGDSPTIDCISNPPYSGGAVLGYGESVTFGGFSCVSRSTGITCVDSNSSGFTLSREAYTAY